MQHSEARVLKGSLRNFANRRYARIAEHQVFASADDNQPASIAGLARGYAEELAETIGPQAWLREEFNYQWFDLGATDDEEVSE